MAAEKIGVAAFSFALHKDCEPSRCNRRLGYDVGRAVRFLKNFRKEAVVASQWEIALALPKDQEVALVVREHNCKWLYLDSREVARQMAEEFRRQGVKKVIVIANPFLHLTKCKREMRKRGFEIVPFKVWWIGFDSDSDQWWTRGPVRLIVGTALRLFGWTPPAHS